MLPQQRKEGNGTEFKQRMTNDGGVTLDLGALTLDQGALTLDLYYLFYDSVSGIRPADSITTVTTARGVTRGSYAPCRHRCPGGLWEFIYFLFTFSDGGRIRSYGDTFILFARGFRHTQDEDHLCSSVDVCVGGNRR